VIATLIVPVTNVAPTGTVTNSGPIAEGGVATVTVQNIIDPSLDDIADILFSYDFGNDGDFTDPGDLFRIANTSVTIPPHIVNDEGSIDVRVRLEDGDGGATDLITTLAVSNVSPTIESGADSVAFVDRSFVRRLALVDPGADGPWSVQVDWTGDGDFDDPEDQTFTTQTRQFEIRHSFATATAGTTIPVTVRVEDIDGAANSDAFNVDSRTIDVTSPTSSIATLPSDAVSLEIPLSVIGNDPAGAVNSFVSGVTQYDLFVATDSGAFIQFATVPANAPTTVFQAESDHTYFFRSVATDAAGNIESKPLGSDTQIRVGDFDLPITEVASAVANSSGLFALDLTGTDTGGGQLVFIDAYVSIDGGPAELITSISAGLPDGAGVYTASTTYQAENDGLEHTYRFFSIGRDSGSNIENAPEKSFDVIMTTTFAAGAAKPSGIDVQLGASQRSYIRFVDVLFNDENGLDDLLLLNPLQVERFALDATDVTPGSGIEVDTFSTTQAGDRLRLDFGLNGITGNRNTNAGDGFYRVLVDGNGDGDYADAVDAAFEFSRILGDADGDSDVDSNDIDVINSQNGRVGSNLNGDIDGSGNVNFFDRIRTNPQIGKELAPPLKSQLDD
jgi:hypothetical protein